MNARMLVLEFIARHGEGVSPSDIFAHVWATDGFEGTSRNYMYHVIRNLRQRGFISTQNKQAPNKSRHFITLDGLKHIRGKKEKAE